MVTPEFRWPMTAATLASTNFCATRVPILGSPWSSSLIMRKLTALPPMWGFFALACAIASATPFSSSLPWCAMPPVSGPATPSVTTVSAWAGVAAGLGGDSVLPQAARTSSSAAALQRSGFAIVQPQPAADHAIEVPDGEDPPGDEEQEE